MKENQPKVIMCKGSVMKLRIGLTIRNSIERTTPPKRKVLNPPDIFSPDIICEVKKSAKE